MKNMDLNNSFLSGTMCMAHPDWSLKLFYTRYSRYDALYQMQNNMFILYLKELYYKKFWLRCDETRNLKCRTAASCLKCS